MQVPAPGSAVKLAASVVILSAALILVTPAYRDVIWIEAQAHLPVGGELELHDALDDPLDGTFSTLRPEVLFEIFGDGSAPLEGRLGAATLLELRDRPLGKTLGREPLGARVAHLLDVVERYPDDPVACLLLYETIKVHRLGEQLLEHRLENRGRSSNPREQPDPDPVSLNAARRALDRGRERDPANGAFAFELAYLALATGDLTQAFDHIAEAGRAKYVTHYQGRRLQAANALLRSRGLPEPESKEFVHAAIRGPSPAARGVVRLVARLARDRFEAGDRSALEAVTALFTFGDRYHAQAQTLLQAQLGLQLCTEAISTFMRPAPEPISLRGEEQVREFADLLSAHGRLGEAEAIRRAADRPSRLRSEWREFLKTTDPPVWTTRLLAAGHGYLLVLLLECGLVYLIGRTFRGEPPQPPAPLRRPLTAFVLIVVATILVIAAHQLIVRPQRFGGRLNRDLIDALVLGGPLLLAGLVVTWRQPGAPAWPAKARAASLARLFGAVAIALVVLYTSTFPIALEQRRQIAEEHDRLLQREADFVRSLGT